MPPTATNPDHDDAEASFDDAAQNLTAPGSENSTSKLNLSDSIGKVLSHIQNVFNAPIPLDGLATGFIHLDGLTNGLKPGNMFVIASRPGMGKTSLMLSIVENLCLDEKVPTLLVSGVMTSFEMLQRLAACRT